MLRAVSVSGERTNINGIIATADAMGIAVIALVGTPESTAAQLADYYDLDGVR